MRSKYQKTMTQISIAESQIIKNEQQLDQLNNEINDLQKRYDVQPIKAFAIRISNLRNKAIEYEKNIARLNQAIDQYKNTPLTANYEDVVSCIIEEWGVESNTVDTQFDINDDFEKNCSIFNLTVSQHDKEGKSITMSQIYPLGTPLTDIMRLIMNKSKGVSEEGLTLTYTIDQIHNPNTPIVASSAFINAASKYEIDKLATTKPEIDTLNEDREMS